MKNKRFMSIAMVLLTAVFVFCFAAVTKNTAMKASAEDYGSIVVSGTTVKNKSETGDKYADLSVHDIAVAFFELTDETGRDERTEALFDNISSLLKGCAVPRDSLEFEYVMELYKDDPKCSELLSALKDKVSRLYAGSVATAAASSVMTTRRQPTTEPQSPYDEDYTSEDGILSFIIRSDHAIVSRCRENVTGTVEIPATVKGKPVTALAENSFSNCEVNEVIVPDGVVYIGHYAFSYSGIETVILPSSLEEIGESAFRGCDDLTQITLPEGLEYIGDSAFFNCGKIESIRIPASVKSIGYYAFDCNYYYYGVKSIEVDEGNEVYASKDGVLFDKGMTELLKYPSGKEDGAYTVPDGVVTINDGAFRYCDQVSSITLPQSVSYIGSYAFENCDSLLNINLPESVETIGEGAFEDCGSLESIVIPSGITSINSRTFYECYRLSYAVLPSGIVEIGDYAFANCHRLRRIKLPEDLILIEDSAFAYASLTELKLPDGLISIGGRAFINNDITSLEIPDSVDYVGGYAFANCYLLEKAEFPDGFSLINSGIFGYCGQLKEIILPESIKLVNDSAFNGCASLTDVNYKGTEAQWSKVIIKEYNEPLLSATLNCEYHEHRLKTHTVKATCTKDGEEYEVCEICGNTIGEVRVLKAAGHSWQDDFTIDKEATCSEVGSKSVHCSNCSATKYSTEIAKKAHTVVTDKGVAATCTENGITEGSHCSSCGAVIAEQKVIYATGHTDANNDGVCDACGFKKESAVNIRLGLRTEPSSTLNYGETAVIYVTNTDLPEGTRLVWTISGSGINLIPAADGMSCTVKAEEGGTSTVTVTAYDRNGNLLKSDSGRVISASQTIISNASFLQKIIAFFRGIFGKKSLVSLVKLLTEIK